MINVNKLVGRLSIRTKLVIAFVLLGVVPLGVVGGYGALFSFSLLSQTAVDGLREGVALKAAEVEQFLDMAREDVRLLSRLPVVRVLAGADPADRPAATRAVEEAFLAFSRSRPAYYQVRLLDGRGHEVVRVDFDGARHQRVPPAALQDKSDRYYFREAMATPVGSVYASPLDLNEEWGTVERPPKAVVRYATRVVGRDGVPRGIVVVNVYAARILSQVLRLGQHRGAVLLVDARGTYLADSRHGGAGGHGPATGAALAGDFAPALVGQILAQRPGAVIEPGLGGRILAFAPIRHGTGPDVWMVVHALRKSDALSGLRALQALVLALGAGVLVIALVAGVGAARHFTRPIRSLIRAAEAVEGGDFDQTIRVETNDEIEDLSRQFNRMAGQLKERQRQLVGMREEAERRAREAEALYRIGTDISRPLPLGRILELVVDRARALLDGDVVILCLTESGGSLRLGAVSGLPESLTLAPGELVGSAAGCARVGLPGAACTVVHGMRLATHVAVPCRTGDRAVGSLCVGSRHPRSVEPEAMAFLERLANQAAIAIESARLRREVRDLAALEERERIGLDLHDGIIQSIYATGLGLEGCVRLAEESPAQLRPRLEAAIASLNTVIRDVRNYIVGLDPEPLRDPDLARALDRLVRGLVLNALLGADLSVEEGVERELGADQVSHLFQIAREALTNVLRHARASRVAVTLRREGGEAVLSVEDDGVGFDPGTSGSGGRGLGNMAERARRVGGELSVSSVVGCGTRLVVRVPLGAGR